MFNQDKKPPLDTLHSFSEQSMTLLIYDPVELVIKILAFAKINTRIMMSWPSGLEHQIQVLVAESSGSGFESRS